MTYREMRELSYAGFGVFQDEAIIPAVKAAIPINIRNTNRPEAPGTMIVHHRRARQGSVVGIASSAGFCTLYVDKYMMNREVGFGRKLLQILEEEGISYEHMPSGIDNVSVVFRENGFTPDVEARVRENVDNAPRMPECVKKSTPLAGDYYILNCTEYTSVICECGFLSSAADEALLVTDDYREKLADAIYRGILAYLSSAASNR